MSLNFGGDMQDAQAPDSPMRSVVARAGSNWSLSGAVIGFVVLCLYGWTVFEPIAGDGLMHMMDDAQFRTIGDWIRPFYTAHNPKYVELHRLGIFHRPVFDEIYVGGLKKLFGLGGVWSRVPAVLLLGGAGILFLQILRNLGLSLVASTVAALWLVCAPSLFFGVYEFGLAFIELLLFFFVLAIFCLQKTVLAESRTAKIAWGLGCCVSTFLAVFTKESGLVLPLAFVFLLAFFSEPLRGSSARLIDEPVRQVKAMFKYWPLVLALVGVTALYLATRYLKLGSLTAVAGGIEQKPSVGDVVVKIITYTLLPLQVPTSGIPNYLTRGIRHLSGLEAVARWFLLGVGLLALGAGVWRRRTHYAVLLVLAGACFLPLIVVSRNSPYYADTMTIPVALGIAIGLDALARRFPRKAFHGLALLTGCALVIAAASFAHRYVYDYDMWLARSQGFSRAALSDLSSAEGLNDATQIVGSSGMYSAEQRWALSHYNVLGSGFIVNLHVSPEKLVDNSDQLKSAEKVMFIDFVPDPRPRRLGSGALPGFGRLETHYFPNGFIREPLTATEDRVYPIFAHPVVRLECAGPLKAPFQIEFASSSAEPQRRIVDPQMSLRPDPQPAVLEFVAPEGAETFNLQDGGTCVDAKVQGYKALDRTALKFEQIANTAPDFKPLTAWSGQAKIDPAGGVIVGPGADNPNVLTQAIPVQPYEVLKIVARASRGGSEPSMGRLQISWAAADGHYLSSSGATFEAGAELREHEAIVVAPAGAASGILYVTPHAPGQVMRYTTVQIFRASR